jgi:hypothetical protein
MLAIEQNDIKYRLHSKFEDCGRRWAERMLDRLQGSWLDVPLVWPGTHEQALTIVHALREDSFTDLDCDSLADVVQHGARLAWRGMVGDLQLRVV